MNILHFTLGPVQSFFAQARRTRDLWAGSFLLSYLTGQAMATVLENDAAKILLPLVGDEEIENELLAAILAARAKQKPQSTPIIGSLPNFFKAALTQNDTEASKALAQQMQADVQHYWQHIARAVHEKYFKGLLNDEQQAIWDEQVDNFWQMSWVIGEVQDENDSSTAAWLDQRKNWRSYLAPAQAGDKCTLMGEWQELSGYIRAQQKEKDNKQAAFWQKVRQDSGINTLDLGDSERLCAIALIKRLFPHVAQEAIGWEVDVQSWPSTSYFAAIPWLRAIQENTNHAEALRAKTKNYYNLVQESVESSRQNNARLACLDSPALRDFQRLDGQLFYKHSIENAKEDNYKGAAAQAKRNLQEGLKDINELVGYEPSPFYALLMMDGDSLGKLLQKGEMKPATISQALADFSKEVEPIVRSHCGKTIYAGGDDVLALLPLDRAIDAANTLRKAYRQAFAGKEKGQKATISAGLCFAHYRTSLRAVRQEANRLLDDVAKDGNGRDSIAVSVLTSSGRNVEWCSSWHDSSDGISISHLLQELSNQFGVDKEFASTFFYNVRERFEILTTHQDGTQKNPQIFTDNAAENLLENLLLAEYKKSREVANQRKGVLDGDIKIRMQELLRVCRIRSGEDSQEQKNSLNMQGALLVRFLATKGEGLEA